MPITPGTEKQAWYVLYPDSNAVFGADKDATVALWKRERASGKSVALCVRVSMDLIVNPFPAPEPQS